MKNKGQKTKEEIISQSLQLFSLKGYFNTSIQDVLKATGLTKGGLYCHFAGKQAIWKACHREAVRVWQSIVFRRSSHELPAYEQLTKILEDDLLEYLGKDTFRGGCFFFNMLIELAGQEPELVHTLLDGFKKFELKLAGLIRQAIDEGDLPKGVPIEKAATHVMVMINGAAAVYAAQRDKQLLTDTLDQLFCYLRSFPDTV